MPLAFQLPDLKSGRERKLPNTLDDRVNLVAFQGFCSTLLSIYVVSIIACFERSNSLLKSSGSEGSSVIGREAP